MIGWQKSFIITPKFTEDYQNFNFKSVNNKNIKRQKCRFVDKLDIIKYNVYNLKFIIIGKNIFVTVF